MALALSEGLGLEKIDLDLGLEKKWP